VSLDSVHEYERAVVYLRAAGKLCHDILSTSVNFYRPYSLSSTSISKDEGKRQNDVPMHDRPCIGIEGLLLIEHGVVYLHVAGK
jgi:hypothetical protein